MRQIKLGAHPAMSLAEARKAWGARRESEMTQSERIRASTSSTSNPRVAEAAALRQRAYTVGPAAGDAGEPSATQRGLLEVWYRVLGRAAGSDGNGNAVPGAWSRQTIGV